MFKRLFKKQIPLMMGLDIGSHSVKAVLLSQTGDAEDGGYRLDAFAVEPLPKGAVAEREIQDLEAVARVISKIRKKIPKHVRQVAMAVSGATVISKVIYMDVNLSDDELAGQIEVEADSLIPYPLNEVSLDFEKLAVNDVDPSKVNVLLSAARTESIETRKVVVESSGFVAKVIDVESYALCRAARLCLGQLAEELQDKIVAMIDIGATMTLFSVIDNHRNIYTRDQMFGGEQYTQSIIAYYERSYDESERAKVTNDLPANYAFEVLAPFQTTLVQQVRRSLQMFGSTTGKDNIDALILSGGTSQIAGLDQLLIEELGIHTVIANPFINMEIDASIDKDLLDKHQSELVVAAGLALRSFSEWHI